MSAASATHDENDENAWPGNTTGQAFFLTVLRRGQKTNCGILLRGAGMAAARALSLISARSNHNRCATKRLKRISPAEKEICI
ncbi:hypothetical protein [Pandoraea horticolens]|uniref:hypothetical protein n=1 Tax=Pandoraea horticolens TaxID=2508298 RepID=UPI0012414D44|nr:hypothetical protein [Pandoraea horticolens]